MGLPLAIITSAVIASGVLTRPTFKQANCRGGINLGEHPSVKMYLHQGMYLLFLIMLNVVSDLCHQIQGGKMMTSLF